MTTPERIWLDKAFQPWRVWTIEMSELPEYVRRDPAVLAELPEVRALVAAETERCAKVADAYADENIRMAGDTVLLDPVLHTPKGHKLTAKDFAKSEELVVSGAVHSAMFHAAQNIAAAIREGRNG